MKKAIIATVVVLMLGFSNSVFAHSGGTDANGCHMPAFAATEYWVAKDAATKKCEVVTKKPDGTKLTDAGKKTYATKGDADKALKLLADCK